MSDTLQPIKIEEVIPAGGQVIVQPDAVQETVSGIYQPNKGEEKPQFGTVIAAGPLLEDQKMFLTRFEVGQRVIYRKWGGNDVKIDGKLYYFLKYDEIIGVVK